MRRVGRYRICNERYEPPHTLQGSDAGIIPGEPLRKALILHSLAPDRSRTEICIHQRDYAQILLAHFGMKGCNAVLTPLSVSVDLSSSKESERKLSPDANHLYRAMVGGRAYLSTCTRRDITFAISTIS